MRGSTEPEPKDFLGGQCAPAKTEIEAVVAIAISGLETLRQKHQGEADRASRIIRELTTRTFADEKEFLLYLGNELGLSGATPEEIIAEGKKRFGDI